MADTTTPRRCGLCRRPLPPHRHELCAPCVGNLRSALHDHDHNPRGDDDMREDVAAMNAAANEDEAR